MVNKCDPFSATPGGCVPSTSVFWVRKPQDPSPKPVYLQITCVAGLAVRSLTDDSEGLVPSSYTEADKIATVQYPTRGGNCEDPVHVAVCEPGAVSVDATTCDGAPVPVQAKPVAEQVVNVPGTALLVKMCDPTASLKIELSETLLYSASTEQTVMRVRIFNEDLGTWSLVYENLDGTPFTGTLPPDLVAVSAQVQVVRTTEPGCSAGQVFTQRTTARFDSETGALESEVIDWVDATGAVLVVAPAGFVLGECCKPSKHFEFSYYSDSGLVEPTPSQLTYMFPNFPGIGADFPGTTDITDLYVHAIEYAINGNIYAPDGSIYLGTTAPVLWSNAQGAMNAALAAMGLPANSVLLRNDGAGQPLVTYDTLQVSQLEIIFWAGTAGQANYTNKTTTGPSYSGPIYGDGACRKIEVLKTLACDGTLTLNGFELDGTVITGFNSANLLAEASACNPPVVNKIYLSENTAVTSIVDIMASAGAKKLHSLTIKQVQGVGILTGDSGGGVTLQLGEVWSWGVVSQAQTESLDTATLTMDANGGTQRITAIYTI